MLERHLDASADAVLVDVVHREALDVVFPEDAFFRRVHIAQADVDAAERSEGRRSHGTGRLKNVGNRGFRE